MRIIQRVSIVVMLMVGFASVRSQTYDGGTQNPFSFGVDSRAFSLGNAAVAYPQDASAMFWNPAGITVVDQQVAGLSLSTLFESTQYQYGGIVMPTLSTGTFAVGVARIGTDGIPRTDWSNQTIDLQGEMGYWWGQLNLAYGLRIVGGLSVGVAFEANRIVLGDWSTNGFGLNGGLHYSFPQQSGFLSNLHVGATAYNLIRPQLSLGSETQSIPMTLRGGIAKKIRMGESGHWLLLADVVKPELGDLRYHAGLELMLGNVVSLRGGFNNGQITVGGGIRYRDFAVDYATGSLNDTGLLPWTHRFSLSFYMGKTLSERRAQIENVKKEEIETRFRERLESDRQQRVRQSMVDARSYMEKEDYFNARLEIASVLEDDPGNREAEAMLDDIEVKELAYQQQREVELLKAAQIETIKQQDINYIRRRRQEANSALNEGNVRGAIEAWELALSRDPEDQQIKGNLEQGRTRLESLITELIAQARRLIRQEAISEAYKKLERAKGQALGNQQLEQRVDNEIRVLDREVDFLHNYQEGEKRFEAKDYEGAIPYLQRALTYKPNHESVTEMLQISRTMLAGGQQRMRDDVHQKYLQGIQLYRNKNYQEALEVWQEALELDPTDTRVIRAIRGVRRKLKDIKEK